MEVPVGSYTLEQRLGLILDLCIAESVSLRILDSTSTLSQFEANALLVSMKYHCTALRNAMKELKNLNLLVYSDNQVKRS